VQQCPGAKGLWCDALRPPLLLAAPVAQLRQMADMLPEKELRLRNDLPAAPDE
jgi:hypothetical protein